MMSSITQAMDKAARSPKSSYNENDHLGGQSEGIWRVVVGNKYIARFGPSIYKLARPVFFGAARTDKWKNVSVAMHVQNMY